MTIVLNGTTGITTPADTVTTITSPAATALTIQSAGTTAITVDTAQNVGIGTTTPLAKTNIYNSSNNFPLFVQGGSAANGGDGGSIAFAVAVGSSIAGPSTAAAAIRSLNTYAGETNGQEGPLAFYTNQRTGANTYTGLVERARIDASGNLLVGATSSGGNGVIISPETGGGNIAIRSNITTSRINQYFINGNGLVGNITTSGSSTSYVTSSDYRLKDTIAPMTGALTKVALLKPVTYKWKVDGSDGQGFIAHELAEVEPGCVTGEKDAVDADGNPRYQGIDTSFLVATLTAAIQEQQAIITALTARITALETK